MAAILSTGLSTSYNMNSFGEIGHGTSRSAHYSMKYKALLIIRAENKLQSITGENPIVNHADFLILNILCEYL